MSARESTDRTADDSVAKYLTFTLCGEQYALPLLSVKEVIGLTETTPIPYVPSYFKGIMNLRGQVISVVDLRLRFKLNQAATTPETAIIILEFDSICIGAIVDSIDSVLPISDDEISPSPQVESTTAHDFIEGVARKGDDLILLLASERALGVDEVRKAEQRMNVRRKAS